MTTRSLAGPNSSALRHSSRANSQEWGVYATLTLICLASLFPFFWTVASSLKQPSEIYVFPPAWVPAVPQWKNYARVFQLAPFHVWVGNSLYVVGRGLVGSR